MDDEVVILEDNNETGEPMVPDGDDVANIDYCAT
jgi:hypothetical protein